MSSIFSPNFQFTFSLFDKVTYVTGSYRLTPRSTECKHLLKDSAFNSLQDRICLQNSLGGGGKPILSHPSNKRGLQLFFDFLRRIHTCAKVKDHIEEKIFKILYILSHNIYNNIDTALSTSKIYTYL